MRIVELILGDDEMTGIEAISVESCNRGRFYSSKKRGNKTC
jgi:hypothetical protein